MLRFLLKHKITVAYIPEILVKMRMGGKSNISLKTRISANLMDRRAWKINGLSPHFLTLWLKPIRKIFQFLPVFHK
jgi:glycosyltransferase